MTADDDWKLPPIDRPVPILAGIVDAFLQGYLAQAPEWVRPYVAVDVQIVRSLLGVPEHTEERDRPLVESCGCCLVSGIGAHTGGLSILYYSPELGHHHVKVSCHPWQDRVSVPSAENPPI